MHTMYTKVSPEARRGCQSPWNLAYRLCEALNVGTSTESTRAASPLTAKASLSLLVSHFKCYILYCVIVSFACGLASTKHCQHFYCNCVSNRCPEFYLPHRFKFNHCFSITGNKDVLFLLYNIWEVGKATAILSICRKLK